MIPSRLTVGTRSVEGAGGHRTGMNGFTGGAFKAQSEDPIL